MFFFSCTHHRFSPDARIKCPRLPVRTRFSTGNARTFGYVCTAVAIASFFHYCSEFSMNTLKTRIVRIPIKIQTFLTQFLAQVSLTFLVYKYNFNFFPLFDFVHVIFLTQEIAYDILNRFEIITTNFKTNKKVNTGKSTRYPKSSSTQVEKYVLNTAFPLFITKIACMIERYTFYEFKYYIFCCLEKETYCTSLKNILFFVVTLNLTYAILPNL